MTDVHMRSLLSAASIVRASRPCSQGGPSTPAVTCARLCPYPVPLRHARGAAGDLTRIYAPTKPATRTTPHPSARNSVDPSVRAPVPKHSVDSIGDAREVGADQPRRLADLNNGGGAK